jgi:hypothetical protein
MPLALGIVVVGATLVTAVAIFAAGCGHSRTEPQETSMKGWELHSWQEGGRWYFSLLVGTNRTKTVAEMHAAETRLKGVQNLEPALRGVAPGQWVMWWTPSWAEGTVSLPPMEMVDEVRRICDEQGIQLQVATEGP